MSLRGNAPLQFLLSGGWLMAEGGRSHLGPREWGSLTFSGFSSQEHTGALQKTRRKDVSRLAVLTKISNVAKQHTLLLSSSVLPAKSHWTQKRKRKKKVGLCTLFYFSVANLIPGRLVSYKILPKNGIAPSLRGGGTPRERQVHFLFPHKPWWRGAILPLSALCAPFLTPSHDMKRNIRSTVNGNIYKILRRPRKRFAPCK